MKYQWEELPKPLNCFTVRSARMVNLNTGKIVSNYSANTRITVVQKCVTPKNTYYRTASAVHHNLNYAFEASAFGLPNEKAPSVPCSTPSSKPKKPVCPAKLATEPVKKQKPVQKVASPKGGEVKAPKHWWQRLFRRGNG